MRSMCWTVSRAMVRGQRWSMVLYDVWSMCWSMMLYNMWIMCWSMGRSMSRSMMRCQCWPMMSRLDAVKVESWMLSMMGRWSIMLIWMVWLMMNKFFWMVSKSNMSWSWMWCQCWNWRNWCWSMVWIETRMLCNMRSMSWSMMNWCKCWTRMNWSRVC